MSSRQCNQPGRKCNAPRAYLEMGSNLASSADLNLSRMIPFSSSRLCPVLILIHSDSGTPNKSELFTGNVSHSEPLRSNPTHPRPPRHYPRPTGDTFASTANDVAQPQTNVKSASIVKVMGQLSAGQRMVASPRRGDRPLNGPGRRRRPQTADREMRARRAGISCVVLAASSYVVPFQCGPALMLFRLPRRRVPFRSPGSSNFHHVSRGAASHAVCKEDLLGPGTLSQKN
jgi:hypothetical protein